MASKKSSKHKTIEETQRIENSFSDVVAGVVPEGMVGNISGQPFTLSYSAATALVTLQRVTLHNAYAHKGLVRTVIDTPVDDAFRGGFDITTNNELSTEDIEQLRRAMDEHEDIKAVTQTLKWGRLYGGAGCIIADGTNPELPLDKESIAEGDPLAFRAADRWELFFGPVGQEGFIRDEAMREIESKNGLPPQDMVTYYNVKLHPSRVLRVIGTDAPSMLRQMLMGHGLSELERCMPEINAYIKFQDMIFELVDEAKLDIYKINQFTNALASAGGVQRITKHIQLNNQMKNYKSAIIMDKEDEFEAKQMSFSGIADILIQFRINLASAVGIPQAKLFGESASGFSSGEDWLENYNSMVEHVRAKAKTLLMQVVGLRCKATFGFIPESLDIKFPPLRVMSAVEEEQVATSKTNRALSLFDRGILAIPTLEDVLHRERLLTVELEDSAEFRESMLTAGQPKDDNTGGGKPSYKGGSSGGKDGKKTRSNAVESLHYEFLKNEKAKWKERYESK